MLCRTGVPLWSLLGLYISPWYLASMHIALVWRRSPTLLEQVGLAAVASATACCISASRSIDLTNICPDLTLVLVVSLFFSAIWCSSISSVNYSFFLQYWSSLWHIFTLWIASSSNCCSSWSVSLCLTAKCSWTCFTVVSFCLVSLMRWVH